MRHGVKKIKFNAGIDANKMLVRKLALSFLSKGYLQTTLPKARVLKTHIEKLVSKMKVKNEANKNFLLRYLADGQAVNDGFDRVGPALMKINGGYIRIVKLGMRTDDGAAMAKVQWAYPVVKEEVKKPLKNEKSNKTDKTS